MCVQLSLTHSEFECTILIKNWSDFGLYLDQYESSTLTTSFSAVQLQKHWIPYTTDSFFDCFVFVLMEINDRIISAEMIAHWPLGYGFHTFAWNHG